VKINNINRNTKYGRITKDEADEEAILKERERVSKTKRNHERQEKGMRTI